MQFAYTSNTESKLIKQILSYLNNNYRLKNFYLVTATPQLEMEEILQELLITNYFDKIIGSPVKKIDAVKHDINLFFF